MEELSCPRCRMTKYRNPSLRLMINVCGHALCEACVDLLFIRESGSCPDCGLPLRRSGFRTQLFEDTTVDKEVDVRKQITKIFNKQETDFSSLRDYNDYLEEIEDIIDSMVSGKNVEEARAKVSAYKAENETIIRRNQVRLNQERMYIQEQIEKEKRESELRRHIQDEMEKELNTAKRKKQQNLIDDLKQNQHMTPQQVLEMHKQRNEEMKLNAISNYEERMAVDMQDASGHGIQMNYSTGISNTNIPSVRAFQYEKVEENILGPTMPGKTELIECGYLQHVRESSARDTGGGYSSLLACSRALQEAFTGLLYNPTASSLDIR